MRTLMFLPAALVLCASLGASPATAGAVAQGAGMADSGPEIAEDMAEGASENGDANDYSDDDGDEDRIADAVADEASNPDDARPQTRTRFERKRYLHASAHRKAVRRVASVQHRRVYRYHRYLRSAGPFYRKNLRRPPLPVEDVEE